MCNWLPTKVWFYRLTSTTLSMGCRVFRVLQTVGREKSFSNGWVHSIIPSMKYLSSITAWIKCLFLWFLCLSNSLKMFPIWLIYYPTLSLDSDELRVTVSSLVNRGTENVNYNVVVIKRYNCNVTYLHRIKYFGKEVVVLDRDHRTCMFLLGFILQCIHVPNEFFVVVPNVFFCFGRNLDQFSKV